MSYSTLIGPSLGWTTCYLLCLVARAVGASPLEVRSITADSAVFSTETSLTDRNYSVTLNREDFEGVFQVTQLVDGRIQAVYATQAEVLAARLYQTKDHAPAHAVLELSLSGLLPATNYRAQAKSRCLNDSDSVLLFAEPWSPPVEFVTAASVASVAPVLLNAHAITPYCVTVSWMDINVTEGIQLVGYVVQSRPLTRLAGHHQSGFGSWGNVESYFSRESLLALSNLSAGASIACPDKAQLPSAYMLGLLHDSSVTHANVTMPAVSIVSKCRYTVDTCTHAPGKKYEFRAAAVVRPLGSGTVARGTVTGPWSVVHPRIQVPLNASRSSSTDATQQLLRPTQRNQGLLLLGDASASSYRRETALQTQRYSETGGRLTVKPLADRSIALTWNAQGIWISNTSNSPSEHWQEVAYYELSIDCLNDTLVSTNHVVDGAGLETYSVIATNLVAGLRYRATLATAPGPYANGTAVEFDIPQNNKPTWEVVQLAHVPAEMAATEASTGPNDMERTLPVLRGASISVVNRAVYIFGGLTMSRDGRKPGGVIASAAVIEVDTLAQTWNELFCETRPPGRERHIAQIYSGYLYIWGGGDQNDPTRRGGTPYNDMWRFALPPGHQPGRVIRLTPKTYAVSGSTGTDQQLQCNPADGSDRACGVPETEAVLLDLIPTQIDGYECVQNIHVRVEIRHAAPWQLGIELMGPYPMSTIRSIEAGSRRISRSPMNNSEYQGNVEGNTVPLASAAPQAGMNPWNTTTSLHLEFQADYPIGAPECYARPSSSSRPEFGSSFLERARRCKPQGDLRRFIGSHVRSSWALRFQDYEADGIRGTIIDAYVDLHVNECHRAYEWENITSTSPTIPKASVDAISAMYDGMWYVLLAADSTELYTNEMWVYKFSVGSWVTIDSSVYPNHYRPSFAGMMSPFMRGSTSSWTAWGLAALKVREGGEDNPLWFYSESSRAMIISVSHSPLNGAFGSACFLDASDSHPNWILAFGGQDQSSDEIGNSMWLLAFHNAAMLENYLDMSAT